MRSGPERVQEQEGVQEQEQEQEQEQVLTCHSGLGIP